jgi:putative peptidoglycan lipid II flippase
MSKMLKSSGALGAATLTSRVLGLVREIVYARFMGDGWVAGAFMLAFMVPNLFRRLLGEGALTAAFIPIFKEKEKLEGEQEMWQAARAVISALLIGASGIIALGIIIISIILASGWVEVGKTLLMLELLRIMFPYVLLVCLAAIFMGMLNSRGHFFVPAIGATMLNLVMIASVLWLAPRMGAALDQQIKGLAIGVVVAGFVQAFFQSPLLRKEGFRYQWVSPFGNDTVRRVVRQMLPATLGVAAYQLNVMFTQGLAFWVDAGVVASFQYAVRLMELPQGVFGLSLATYLLPTLSGMAAEKKYPEFRSTLGQGLGYLVFINLLASVLLLTLAEPMIRLLLERGKFHEDSTMRASLALACLAPGLVAYSVVNILARAFYALSDTTTPMKISVFCLVLNAVFTLALVWQFKQVGLGVANSVTAMVNMILLFVALRKKLGKLELADLMRHLPSLLGSAFVAGVVAWSLAGYWTRQFGHANLWTRIGEVFLPMTAASLIYFGLAWWLKVPFLKDLGNMVPGRLRRFLHK